MNENLGKLGKDRITGFTGIINGVCYYLTGCIQYSMVAQRLKEDGSTIDNHWFDEVRVEIVGDGIILNKEKIINEPAGPQQSPSGRQG